MLNNNAKSNTKTTRRAYVSADKVIRVSALRASGTIVDLDKQTFEPFKDELVSSEVAAKHEISYRHGIANHNCVIVDKVERFYLKYKVYNIANVMQDLVATGKAVELTDDDNNDDDDDNA